MNYNYIIQTLSNNKHVFEALLKGLPEEEYSWKQSPEKWSLLEIICHLYDEEREDFRPRTKQVLKNPSKELSSINPVGWVEEKKYMQQNFAEKLESFIEERETSILWLMTLSEPKWENVYTHPELGEMTAKQFLANWLAHDHLHIRQITKLKYEYLKFLSGESLNYAGEW